MNVDPFRVETFKNLDPIQTQISPKTSNTPRLALLRVAAAFQQSGMVESVVVVSQRDVGQMKAVNTGHHSFAIRVCHGRLNALNALYERRNSEDNAAPPHWEFLRNLMGLASVSG